MTDKQLFIDKDYAFSAYQNVLANSSLLEIHYQSYGIRRIIYGIYNNPTMSTFDKAPIVDFFIDDDYNVHLDNVGVYLKAFSATTEFYELKAIEDYLSGKKNWELLRSWNCSDTMIPDKVDLLQLANSDGIVLAQKLAIQFGLQIDARSGINLLAAICLQMMSIRKITVFTLLYGIWSEDQLCELIYQAENDAVYYSDKITFLEYRVINEVLM